MKNLRQGLSLALVVAGLSAVPGFAATAAAPTSSPAAAGDALVSRLRDAASDGVTITRNPATGKVGFVRARSGDLYPAVEASGARGSRDKAASYVDEYAPAFGASADQLTRSDTRSDGHGTTVVYDQVYDGVPVFGAQLRLHLDRQGDLTSVNGYTAPDLDLSTDPRLSAADAGASAVREVRLDPPEGTDGSGLTADASELVVYRTGSVRGETGAAVLAYAVEVVNGTDVRDMVIVDAKSGKPVNRYSMIHSAIDREVYEAGGSTDPSEFELVWAESQPTDGLTPSQVDLVEGTGDAYWFFSNSFNRDSYDGAGATMRTVNNDGRISCPNANWNGQTTNYCDGVTSDDTVAHEWAHAYTEYTSGLIYQWQAGAMNESFSDIWGETVDQINDRFNETPDGPRTVGQCSSYTRGDIAMTITAPASAAGDCTAAAASFGPVFDAEGVTSDVVVATDDATDGTTATDGCTAFTNAAAVAGKFAYVDRGTCTFAVKAQNAQDAGATGVVVGNNAPGDPTSISGSADIYGVMVTQADGARIKTAGTVTATIKDAATAPRDDSYRWLSGEGDPAFGGAIRDMWAPTCYGDPGKVSDAEYYCSSDDGGGVHSNSGVPNHAYALLVDGGTYNGVDVTGLGLTKAANVFWRAQSEYLTPTSDFTSLADSLEASCADLVGQPIDELSTEPGAGATPATPIVAADCDAVAAVTRAVELRTEPVQCDFQPILDPDDPALCGADFTTETTWSEDFEDGLTGWTADQEVVYEGGHGYPWEATAEAPEGNATTVAYAPDPTDGSCGGDADDISSRDGLTSPVVELPAGTAPKLSFDHYVATEAAYDGGNVKYSVNGGAFAVVPDTAYLFNGPNAALETEAGGNTNPLAGEPGWTGTDGGELYGSWGTTIVDLAQLGAAGDDLQFRFDFGRDGCGGFDGWYVDDLQVTVCAEKPDLIGSRTKAHAAPGAIRAGGRFLTLVDVDTEKRGVTPTGKVEILLGDEVIATGRLGRFGIAAIGVRDTDGLKRGTNTLLARYLGSDTVEGSEDTFRVRVRRR